MGHIVPRGISLEEGDLRNPKLEGVGNAMVNNHLIHPKRRSLLCHTGFIIYI